MTHASVFSGIGAADLAAEEMDWENVIHNEINPFGRQVLKYYWPNSISYEDIKKTDFTIHRGTIDVLTGGFPCQPYSTAGKRKGKEDERHLWPEMLRAIREIQPRWVVGENVLGLVNWNGGLVFDEVQADLEAEGYEVQPYILPAASVNAPHRRDRVWFVAYRCDAGVEGVRRQKTGAYECDASANTNSFDRRANNNSAAVKERGHGINLIGAIQKINQNGVVYPISSEVRETMMMLPTPTAQDFKRRSPNSKQQGLSNTENWAVCSGIPLTGMMNTPTVNDAKNSTLPKSQVHRDSIVGDILKTGTHGQLNPRFVLEMMGFPPNHCDNAFDKIAWDVYQKKKSTKSFQKRIYNIELNQLKQQVTL